MITLTLPPLRERLDDVPALATHFLKRAVTMGIHGPCVLSDRAVQALQQYQWPGNIRELENVLTRALILCPEDRLEPVNLHLTDSLSPRQPRPRQALLPVSTMRAWKPTAGSSSKKRCAEMDGTKPEHPKSLAFSEPTSQNYSVRKKSRPDLLKIPPHLLRTIHHLFLSPGGPANTCQFVSPPDIYLVKCQGAWSGIHRHRPQNSNNSIGKQVKTSNRLLVR